MNKWGSYKEGDKIEYSVAEFEVGCIYKGKVIEIFEDSMLIDLDPPLSWKVKIREKDLDTVRKRKK